MEYPQRIVSMLQRNQRYVESRARRRKPDTAGRWCKTVVVCDALPGLPREVLEAFGLDQGEVALVSVAGAVADTVYGEVARSVLAAVARYQVMDVIVVGRDDVAPAEAGLIADELVEAGLSPSYLRRIVRSDAGAAHVVGERRTCDQMVRKTVYLLRNHPLVPRTVSVWGFALEPESGRVRAVQ